MTVKFSYPFAMCYFNGKIIAAVTVFSQLCTHCPSLYLADNIHLYAITYAVAR